MEEFFEGLLISCLKGDIDDLSFETIIKILGDKNSVPLLVFRHLHNTLWKALYASCRDSTELPFLKSLFEANENNLNYYDELFDRVLLPTL